MDLATIIQRVDELKTEIAALRPIDWEQEQRILQKFHMDWNYHSNAIEGNTLTYGETRAFLLHGITAQGKPFRDYLDIKGHQEAIQYLEQFVQQQHLLTEADIRELHKVLLIESYDMPAITPNGLPARRRIAVGQYKTASNSVQTSTGAMHFYATPEETPALMGDLMKWYRDELQKGTLHPIVIAATFHYRFVSIHPFDDGNGRMARLLMNLFLMQAGFVPVIIPTTTKAGYLLALESADAGDLEPFIALIGQNLIHALELFLRGAKGEKIDDLADLDKRIALLQKRLEAQGQVTIEPKNIESQKALATNLIQPFFTKLIKRLLQLEPLFDTLTDTITYEFPGPTVVKIDVESLEEKLNSLITLLKSREGIYRINFTYTLQDFMRRSGQSLRAMVDFNLEPHRFAADYAIMNLGVPDSYSFPEKFCTTLPSAAMGQNFSGDLYVKHNLLTGGYHQAYSQEEIDAFVYPIVAEILHRIEQFGQPISSK